MTPTGGCRSGPETKHPAAHNPLGSACMQLLLADGYDIDVHGLWKGILYSFFSPGVALKSQKCWF